MPFMGGHWGIRLVRVMLGLQYQQTLGDTCHVPVAVHTVLQLMAALVWHQRN